MPWLCELLRAFFLVLIFVFLCGGCGKNQVSSQPRSDPKPALSALPAPVAHELERGEVVLFPHGQAPWRVRVEIARSPEERATGLMNRQELAEEQGMLFIFQRFQRHHFYMKNTYIPLDIIFFSGDRGEVSVVGILENMRPFDETPKSVKASAWAALEVKTPLAKRYGIRVGDRAILGFNSPSE